MSQASNTELGILGAIEFAKSFGDQVTVKVGLDLGADDDGFIRPQRYENLPLLGVSPSGRFCVVRFGDGTSRAIPTSSIVNVW